MYCQALIVNHYELPVIPVSYTHLDVYKRQVLNTALVKPNVTAAKKSNEKLPSAKPRASRKPGKNAVKEI